jgi:hypothetical protein
MTTQRFFQALENPARLLDCLAVRLGVSFALSGAVVFYE